MKEYKINFFLFFLLTIAIVNCTNGQEISNLALEKKQSILHDRLFLYLPANVISVENFTNVITTIPDINEETRIELKFDSMILVIFARETYLLSSYNYLNEINKNVIFTYFETRTVKNSKDLYATQSTPLFLDTSNGDIHISNLFVKTKDNSLITIDVYLKNKSVNNKLNDFTYLTNRVFNTLENGTRKLNFNSKDTLIPIFGTNKKIFLNLPKYYIVINEQGPDFEVFKFIKYNSLSNNDFMSLTIYFGDKQSYYYEDYGLSLSDIESVKGAFLKSGITWCYFNDKKRKFIIKEQMIQNDYLRKGMFIHVVMMSNNNKIISELTNIIEKIEIK